MSFYEWLMSHREAKDKLQVLAIQFSALSYGSKRIRNIDSFSDLVAVFRKYPFLDDTLSALKATMIGIWTMYCSSSNHPL